MGVTLQVVEVKVKLVICELMPLSLELEELFTVHDSSSGKTSSGTATTARGKRDTHTPTH